LASVTVKSLENMRQLVVARGHSFVVDEPEDAGGDDVGPAPYELLLASLAT
jgi:putative redox protein